MVLASVATQVVALTQAGSSAAVSRLEASMARHPLAERAVGVVAEVVAVAEVVVVGGAAVVGVGVTVVGVAVVGVAVVGVTMVEEALVALVEVAPQAATNMAHASRPAPANAGVLVMARWCCPSRARQLIGRL